MKEIRELAGHADAALRSAGVKSRTRTTPDGQLVYEVLIPTEPRPLIISARVALPGDEVGALFGKNGKFRKAARAFAKKVAKSKVLGKLGKIAGALGNIIPPPFGTVLKVGVAAGTAASKLAKAAKNGNPKAKALAAAGAKKISASLKSQVPAFMSRDSDEA